ncbi:MAG: hypothetical protein ABSB49_00455 [Polyangia bacterium]
MSEQPRTPIYRLLHGAPMLAGVPVPGLLALLAVATVFGLGAMPISRLAGLLVLALVGCAWVGLAFVYARDKTRVALLLLRLRHPWSRRLDGYSPSQLAVRFAEDAQGSKVAAGARGDEERR